MKTGLAIPAALMFGISIASAHEHWITARPLQKEGATIAEIAICSGHYFPKSDRLPTERFLTGMQTTQPGGQTTPLQPTATGNIWAAETKLDQSGVWIFTFAMQRPQQPAPMYTGRAILVNGPPDNPARYALNEELEIVPGAPVSSLRPGDTLPLTLMHDGVPIAGRISIIPARGSALFLSTEKDRPAKLKINEAGPYLLTAAHAGQTFSLTFTIENHGGAKQ